MVDEWKSFSLFFFKFSFSSLNFPHTFKLVQLYSDADHKHDRFRYSSIQTRTPNLSPSLSPFYRSKVSISPPTWYPFSQATIREIYRLVQEPNTRGTPVHSRLILRNAYSRLNLIVQLVSLNWNLVSAPALHLSSEYLRLFATEAIHRAAEVAQQEQEEREGTTSKKGKSKEVVPPGMLEVSLEYSLSLAHDHRLRQESEIDRRNTSRKCWLGCYSISEKNRFFSTLLPLSPVSSVSLLLHLSAYRSRLIIRLTNRASRFTRCCILPTIATRSVFPLSLLWLLRSLQRSRKYT